MLVTPYKCRGFFLSCNFLEISLQVLVVQEKSGGFRGTGVWKFPTGVVDEVGRARRFFAIITSQKSLNKEQLFGLCSNTV